MSDLRNLFKSAEFLCFSHDPNLPRASITFYAMAGNIVCIRSVDMDGKATTFNLDQDALTGWLNGCSNAESSDASA